MFDKRKVGLNIAQMEFSELQSLCTNLAAFRPSNWMTLFRPWSVFTTPTCLFLAAYKSSICPSLSGSIGRPRFIPEVFSPLPHAHSRWSTRAAFVYPFLGCPSKWLTLSHPWSIFTTPSCAFRAAHQRGIRPSLSGPSESTSAWLSSVCTTPFCLLQVVRESGTSPLPIGLLG